MGCPVGASVWARSFLLPGASTSTPTRLEGEGGAAQPRGARSPSTSSPTPSLGAQGWGEGADEARSPGPCDPTPQLSTLLEEGALLGNVLRTELGVNTKEIFLI